MASYKYRQTGFNNHLIVEYNVNPDLNKAREVGTKITINGRIRCTEFRIRSLSLSFLPSEYEKEIFKDEIDIARNSYGNFKITFTIENYAYIGFEQGIDIKENVWYPLFENTSNYYRPIFTAYSDTFGAGSSLTTNDEPYDDQYLIFKKSKNSPQLENMQIGKYSLKNGEYIQDVNGNYLIFENIKGKAGAESDATKYGIVIIERYQNDEYIEQTCINIKNEIVNSIFSESGYSETRPDVTSSYTLDNAYSYRVRLVIIDYYGHDSYQIVLEKGVVNLHLSGAKKGGACFGGFSTSTDDEPKLESYYKGYFYDGFDNKTIKLIGNILYPIGSVYITNEADFDPDIVFGGEWKAIRGRFLLGANDDWTHGNVVSDVAINASTGGTGGATSRSIAAHHHRSPATRNGDLIGFTSTKVNTATGSVNNIHYVTSKSDTAQSNVTVYSTGDAGSHTVNTVPPYYAVMMWCRVSLYDPSKEIDE